jgi:hypothetical protein
VHVAPVHGERQGRERKKTCNKVIPIHSHLYPTSKRKENKICHAYVATEVKGKEEKKPLFHTLCTIERERRFENILR